MSSIDHYNHKLLGFIECPSTYDFVYLNNTRQIAIYELLDNIPIDEENFDGKVGDILVGGGSGEAPALRISNPTAFEFFTLDEEGLPNLSFEHLDDIYKAFWTPTQAYILAEGFSKLDWTPDRDIDMWLAENVCKALIASIDKFSIYKTANIILSTDIAFTITT